jgi:hypothetical protein
MKVSLIAVNIIVVTYYSKWHRFSLSPVGIDYHFHLSNGITLMSEP